MALQELIEILRRMYNDADHGEQAVMVHLFGIKYSKEIIELNMSTRSLAKAAGIHESYGTEISKGVKLSKYVSVLKRPRL